MRSVGRAAPKSFHLNGMASSPVVRRSDREALPRPRATAASRPDSRRGANASAYSAGGFRCTKPPPAETPPQTPGRICPASRETPPGVRYSRPLGTALHCNPLDPHSSPDEGLTATAAPRWSHNSSPHSNLRPFRARHRPRPSRLPWPAIAFVGWLRHRSVTCTPGCP